MAVRVCIVIVLVDEARTKHPLNRMFAKRYPVFATMYRKSIKKCDYKKCDSDNMAQCDFRQ